MSNIPELYRWRISDDHLANIFRIKNVLDAVILLVGIATALALVLVFALLLRLRQREIRTVFRFGGSRSTVTWLLKSQSSCCLAEYSAGSP